MLRVKIDIKDIDPKGLSNFKKQIESMKDAFVTVGVHEDAGKYTEGKNPPSVSEVALWNEYGTRTTPERSFFRSSLGSREADQTIDQDVGEMMDGKKSVEKGLESIGFKLVTLVQNKIKSNVPPPNAPSTQEQKRRDGVANVTLQNTKLLLRSIAYRVKAK